MRVRSYKSRAAYMSLGALTSCQPQELVIGGQIFPFQTHEEDQHTEVVRFKGSGEKASASEIGTVTHKLQLQVRC